MERLLRINKLSTLLMILIALVQMQGYEACLENERIGLLEIKSFFISVSESYYADEILTSWVDDYDDHQISECCDWERVKCNANTGRVIQLSLNSTRRSNGFNILDGFPILNLSLFLPFQELQNLDLSGNYFDGWNENTDYDSSGSLKQLENINLAYNYFNNSALSYLNTLTSLTTLNLHLNKIGGIELEQGLANLRNLKLLDLSVNGIGDTVTRLGLENLPRLEALDLSLNGIRGSLKVYNYLKRLKKLKILNLNGNLLNDDIVPCLTSLSSLTTLLIHGNRLKEGFKPTQGLANLKNLKVLDLSGNEIGGSLTMQGICELKNLVQLNLNHNSFEGDVPQCLSNLTYLRVLDLSSNSLTGNFQISVIAKLTSLEYLSLFDNYIEGSLSLSALANHSRLVVLLLPSLQIESESIPWLPTFQLRVLGLQDCHINGIFPSFLKYQYDLRYIDLSSNNLVGAFPTWLLQNNTKLEVLFLFNNFLTGTLQLPNSTCDLSRLLIANNNFTGQLPENLGTILPQLVYLDMSQNSFEGNFPPSMGYMERLQLLDMSSNNFSGELPEHFLIGCISLQLLNLSYNYFHGQIFPKYMNFTKLTWLFLNNNQFSGGLEDGLLNSPSLSIVDISNNMLSGQLPLWIGNFSDLFVLLMSRNLFEGSVQLDNLQALRILDISENKLSGPLAISLNHSSMKHLLLQKNAFNGPIPKALFEGSQLVTLDLRDNQFFGNIPHLINSDSNLRALLLKGNNFEGNIPKELCHLQKLAIVDISNNSLNGSIPSCFTNLSLWMVEGDSFKEFSWGSSLLILFPEIGNYYFSTLYLRLPEEPVQESTRQIKIEFMAKNRYESYEGGVLNYMTGLDLSDNELTGDIPSEIGHLQDIHALNLSHNLLSGAIPRSFANLKMIESLDLSYNKLSGQIPMELAELSFLSIFNVSYNNLSGPTPDTGQFSTFDESNYRGNTHLCGQAVKKNCNSWAAPKAASPEEDESSVIDMVAFNWSFGASYVTVILGLSAILLLNSYWHRQWFCLVDACIDSCFNFLNKYVIYQQH